MATRAGDTAVARDPQPAPDAVRRASVAAARSAAAAGAATHALPAADHWSFRPASASSPARLAALAKRCVGPLRRRIACSLILHARPARRRPLVTCGDGQDVVFADAGDTVAADCERVTVTLAARRDKVAQPS